MIRLPYTELHVPTSGVRVTHTNPLPDGGVSGVVEHGDQLLGHIIVYPHAIDVDMEPGERQNLNEFTDRCQDASGRHLPREQVWRHLVMEHLYAQAITEADHADTSQVAVRAVHTDGTITLHQVDAPGPIGPGPELKIDPTLFTPEVAYAQAWMGDLWLPVTPGETGDEHQPRTQLSRLPHTGAQIPARFLMQVSHLTRTEEGGWSAQVWVRPQGTNDTVRLGFLTGDEDNMAFHADRPTAYKILAIYAVMSRGPDGGPVLWEELVSLLLREHHTDREVLRAHRQGYYLLRLTRTGTTDPSPDLVGIMDTTPGGTYPDYESARKCATEFVERPQTARVELWVGDRWVDVPLHSETW